MFVRAKKSAGKTYLMLVENTWEDGKVRQKMIHSLGRLDQLQHSGQLDGVLQSLSRFSEKLAVLGAQERGETKVGASRRIGVGLVGEKLWRELGIGPELERLAGHRKHGFSLERVVFLTVLHRLFVSGSDRAAEKWKDHYALAGCGALELQHLYRGMGWLGEPLPPTQQGGASPFGPRCTKDLLEERLFLRRRNLLSGLDLVFFDTTSIYFEGQGGESLGRYGHSKDHRPDLRQLVVGLVLDQEGRPICSEIWPGNTTDVKSLLPVAARLRQRFGIARICLVADRGMISQDVQRTLEQEGWKYILGVRMRKLTEAREEVLGRAGRFQEVQPPPRQAKDPASLQVKEVWVGQQRYVVCLNEAQRAKDRQDRAAILASLRQALKQGAKSLVGNKGYRRYLKTEGARFALDEERIKAEERYDGKWVLTTNLDLSAPETALRYKQLWTVEEIFRTMKSILTTRPIYHKCDETIRGHVFCSFLALLLRKEIQERLAARGWKLEWTDILRDVEAVSEIAVTSSGKSYVLRSELPGVAGRVFQAVGVQIPPAVRQLETVQ